MSDYDATARERAMKIQEVILRVLAKKIIWWQAAEIIGISDRQMRRWKRRYEVYGYDGLYDRRKGRPSPRRVPLETMEKVLEPYREKYFDLNVRHFREKLVEEQQIGLSYTWVKQALRGAGLIATGRKRGVHRKRRPGRPVENRFIESFNGRLRDECLTVEWFRSRDEVRQKLAAWRHHYNHERPHSALGDQTPSSVAAQYRRVEAGRFALLSLYKALGNPGQGFAAPAEAALDPGSQAPSPKPFHESEAPLRSDPETGASLGRFWSARNPHLMRSGGP